MSKQGPRILQYTTTTGTGPFSLLDPAPKSFIRFRDWMATGDPTTVIILDQNTGDWAELLVTLTYGVPDTLTTLAVLASSAGGSAISFAIGQKVVFQAEPHFSTQAVDKMKLACRAASFTNIPLSSVVVGLVVDQITLAAGDRLGLFAQSTATESGIWIVPSSGSATRALDFSAGDLCAGAIIPVRLGYVNAGRLFQVTNDPGSDVIGTNTLIVGLGNPPGQVQQVAAAGTNQATAAILASGTNLVSGADGTKGVILTKALSEIGVNNLGTAALNVYPPAGGAINDGTTNAALSFPSHTSAKLASVDGLNFYTCPRVPS